MSLSNYGIDDNHGFINLVHAIGYALSEADKIKDMAKTVVPRLQINRDVLERLADLPEDGRSPPMGEAWRVRVKPVGPDLLVSVYREVEYDGGNIGTYDCDEGERYVLFKRSGEVVVGDADTFRELFG